MAAIRRGRSDIAAGRSKSHEEVEKMVESWRLHGLARRAAYSFQLIMSSDPRYFLSPLVPTFLSLPKEMPATPTCGKGYPSRRVVRGRRLRRVGVDDDDEGCAVRVVPLARIVTP